MGFRVEACGGRGYAVGSSGFFPWRAMGVTSRASAAELGAPHEGSRVWRWVFFTRGFSLYVLVFSCDPPSTAFSFSTPGDAPQLVRQGYPLVWPSRAGNLLHRLRVFSCARGGHECYGRLCSRVPRHRVPMPRERRPTRCLVWARGVERPCSAVPPRWTPSSVHATCDVGLRIPLPRYFRGDHLVLFRAGLCSDLSARRVCNAGARAGLVPVSWYSIG